MFKRGGHRRGILISVTKGVQVLKTPVEGNSIRSTVRITGVAENTVAKLLVDSGIACAEYQDRVHRNVTCKKIQCDEIWAFCYPKQKNVPDDKQGQFGFGDVWTWVATDRRQNWLPLGCRLA